MEYSRYAGAVVAVCQEPSLGRQGRVAEPPRGVAPQAQGQVPVEDSLAPVAMHVGVEDLHPCQGKGEEEIKQATTEPRVSEKLTAVWGEWLRQGGVGWRVWGRQGKQMRATGDTKLLLQDDGRTFAAEPHDESSAVDDREKQIRTGGPTLDARACTQPKLQQQA